MSAQKTIEEAWEGRASINPANAPRALRDAVEEVIAGLDAGSLRCALASAFTGSTITFNLTTPATITLTSDELRLGQICPAQSGFRKPAPPCAGHSLPAE